jgi:hypothetical protein
MRIRAATGLLFFLLSVGAAGAVRAAPAPPPPPPADASPGALPFDQLEIFSRNDLTTEINLDGAILKLVSSASDDDDPEFSRLVSGLEAIRVQVAPLTAGNPEKVRAKLDQAVHWLESKGWTAVVRTKEKGEETYIYTKQVKGVMVGLTVLSFELGKEASVVNIVGRLDPAQLGRIGRGFHVHQLDKISPKDKDKDKPRDSKHPG